MPFVPDTSQPAAADPNPAGSFVPDPGQKPAAKESGLDVAKDWGSAIVRPAAKAGIYAATFIPDMATSVINAVAQAGMDTGVLPKSLKSKLPQMPSEAYGDVLDKVTREPTSTFGKVVEEGGAMLMAGGEGLAKAGIKGAEKLVGHLKQNGLTRITSAVAEQAHNAGIKLSPSYIGGKVAKAVQTAVGGAKTDRAFSEANQPKWDNLAKTSLSLHPDEELSETTLDKLRTKADEGYDKLAAIGTLPADPVYDAQIKAVGGRFAEYPSSLGGGYRYDTVESEKGHYIPKEPPKDEPDKHVRVKTSWGYKYETIAGQKAPYQNVRDITAQEAIDEVRALRKIARQNLKQYDPERNALGAVQRQIAGAIDARLERRATVLTKAKVIPKDIYDNYVESRQKLAKIATVEDALGPGGHIIPDALVKAQESGVKLDGGLKIIADTAKHFPKNAQFITKTGSEGVFSTWDFLLGGTGLAASHPVATGIALARPAIRSSLGSGTVQRAMLKRKSGSAVKQILKRGAKGAATRGSEAAQEDDGQ